MAAYHESRVKALSEYFALRYPNTPRVIHMGRSLNVGWQSDTIDSVEGVEGQVIDSGGHFVRQIPHVNLLPSTRFDDERATPEIARQTLVEVAEIQQASIIGRSPRNPIVLHEKSERLSPISWQHIRFRCFGGIWAVEDLGSTSGTIVNGIYIQGRRQSSSSSRSSKRSFSTSVQDIHYSFSASISSSQGSDIASQGKEKSLPSRLTLRPNEINEVQIGGYRLFITPFLRPTSESFLDDLDSRYQNWQDLFPSPDSFWYCSHCERSATRVAVAKLAPVACELSACEKEDLKDFIRRRDRLKPLGNNDRCLERILAIFDGNDGRETPLVASLLNMTAVTLEQKLAEEEAFELCDIKDMLKELLTALALHDIDHGGISKSTIFVDDYGRVHLRGFMKPANLRRLGQDVQDLFEVFRCITPCYPDFKFYKYLSQPCDSVEHARDQFPLPDAAFDEISWTRDVHVYEEVPKHAPALTYIAIGQLCDMLLLENPSEAASYIDKLRDLRRSRRQGVDFDHCTLHDFKKAFPALSHQRLPRTWYGRVPVLKLTGYGTFIECSRLRLWAGRECVDIFDRTYANYPFLDVVSDEGSLNGSYAADRDAPKIVECLKLPKDLFSSGPRQGGDIARTPRFLYYLQIISISLMEASNGEISWSTSDVGEPSIQRSGFAKLLQEKHEYPHIFKIIPRALLDEFKSTMTHEPPLRPDVEEVPSFGFKNRRRASL
ncbi:MAG: hypothetical protein Q9166_007822, partial [cf. Caloplaca sp. 2 TL-2023]